MDIKSFFHHTSDHSTSDAPSYAPSTYSTSTDTANEAPPAYNFDGASPHVPFPEKSQQPQQPQPSYQQQNRLQLLGLNPQFCHKDQVRLVMDQAWSFSGGDFIVTLANGTPIVRCEGSSMSMSKRVSMYHNSL